MGDVNPYAAPQALPVDRKPILWRSVGALAFWFASLCGFAFRVLENSDSLFWVLFYLAFALVAIERIVFNCKRLRENACG